MISYAGDGKEVVAAPSECSTFDSSPLLDLSTLREFFALRGLGESRLGWERIGEGQSNVTFTIESGSQRFVLRRGPRPPHPPSTHDMVREARILGILERAGMPVPRVVAVCEDPGVLGVPFYLMEFVEGAVITDSVPTMFSKADCSAVSEATVDALVRLHRLDVTEGELASVGRPAGYLARQVERFGSLWGLNSRRVIPAVDTIAEWLRDNLPSTQRHSVVHGDYRIGNIMFARAIPVRIAAILDWEMATLGDPLADLGYLTATYAEQGKRWTPMELTSVTRKPGFLSRRALVERYREQMSLDMSSLPWYQTFALWKAAVFCEAMYTRWLAGERPGDEFAASLEQGIPRLLEEAARFAGIDVHASVVETRRV
jgi:aminoglycoside phosphotransferase (APT) family kinase protein